MDESEKLRCNRDYRGKKAKRPAILLGFFFCMGIQARTISMLSDGFACPKAMRGEFTVIAARGFESSKTGRH